MILGLWGRRAVDIVRPTQNTCMVVNELQEVHVDPRKMLWTLKGKAARVPGAYKAYQFATKKVGDGRVYTVPFGPLRGMKWRRDNRLPYWYHLGLWEPAVSNGITEHLRPGDV